MPGGEELLKPGLLLCPGPKDLDGGDARLASASLECVESLERRGGAFYSEAAVELIAAMRGDGSVRVVNLRNDGVLPFLPDDHVIEVPARFDGATFVAEPVAALPDDIAGLIGAVTGYERLALDAAVYGGRDRVLRAMRAHPLVLQHDRAERLTDLLLAANARFLPWA